MNDNAAPAPLHAPDHDAPVGGNPGSEHAHSNEPAAEGGDRKRRRRRGRGGRGRGKGGGQGGGEGRPESGHHHSGAEDHASDEHSSPATHHAEAKPRSAPKPVNANWEEIFEGRTFADIGLRNSVCKGCEAAGFTSPTKIQAELIPLVLSGKDVLGQSRTGTGKTAAFGLPLFHAATRGLPFQSIILAPTRELAIQIASELQELGKFTPIKVSAVYGGQNVQTQARHLAAGPEIIVATPGRLLDMKERGYITFDNVKFAILDEVDRMLDIGFRDDIRKILQQIRTPHQTVFVSATISEEIEKLSRQFMKDPEKLVTTGTSLTVSLVEQYYIAVQPWDKRSMLHYVLTHEAPDLTVIFCRMKRTVDDVAKFLNSRGVDAHAIHGDMYQGKRNSVMKLLRAGQLGVLVASDLAARGLDVDGISHVVNYDLPEDPEVYIHRIGRTARGGRGGVAWSLVAPDQGELLTAIEKLANTHIPEKKYPDFTPGPVPEGVRKDRQREEQRMQQVRSMGSRFGPSLPPSSGGTPTETRPAAQSAAPVAARPAVTIDPARFPGGIVPTKLPPKMLGGRVKTSRSMKAAPLPPPPPPAEKQG